MEGITQSDPAEFLHRLEAATNTHDLEKLVACFAPDYRNETPAHPARGFAGREQVKRNWTQIFSVVRDIRAAVLNYVVDGDTVWSEWEHRGTRPDGHPHVMRGVVIFGVRDGLAAWARFYLEPVQEGGEDADGAVRRVLEQGQA